jgi:hypothetical protein
MQIGRILPQMALLCNLMVMFIASIISIVLLLISYFLIIIFGFRLKNNPYELMTASPRWVKVLSSVFVLTGAALAVGALVISLRKIEDPITPGILITGDTVGVIGLLFLYFFTIHLFCSLQRHGSHLCSISKTALSKITRTIAGSQSIVLTSLDDFRSIKLIDLDFRISKRNFFIILVLVSFCCSINVFCLWL